MKTSTSATDHRRSERMRVNAPVQVRVDEEIVIGVSVRDASLSGAFLLMPTGLPAMSRIWVRQARGSGAWLPAYVARTDRDGVGIQWCDPGVKTLNQLLALRRPLHAAPPPPTFNAMPDRYAVNMRGLPASMM